MKGLIKLLMALYLLLALHSCSERVEPYCVFQTIAFDTEVTVQIGVQEGLHYDALFREISSRILELEKAASLYLEDSELSVLNKSGEKEASLEFLEIVRLAKKAGDETQGNFDVSIQPLWDFYQESSRYSTVDEALALVDYQKINIEGETVTLAPGMKLSFNGFIQGYVTDAIYRILREEGVESALINGGEFRAIGKDRDAKWKVAIRVRNGIEEEEVELADGQSLAVSAGYGYVFQSQNSNKKEIQSHLFSPKNQQPVENSLTYVVKSKGENTAVFADIYATTAAVLGEELWRKSYSETGYELFIFK